MSSPAPPSPTTAIAAWLAAIRLPFDLLARRWKVATTTASLMDSQVVPSSVVSVREWWPVTARTGSLSMHSAVTLMPRQPDETLRAWRQRLALRRSLGTGTREWTDNDSNAIVPSARLAVDMPHDDVLYGSGYWGHGRWWSNWDGHILVTVPVTSDPARVELLKEWLRQEVGADVGVTVAPEGWDS